VATREHPVDRGNLRGRQQAASIGIEIRTARRDRGLALQHVASPAFRSKSWLSRLERGLSETVTVIELARVCSLVGLDLSLRAYPGGSPIRDVAHATVLGSFRRRLHRSIRWAGEVPFPNPGDQRAWDALISGKGWRYGVEAETRPLDTQATARRLLQKARDGGVDGVLLVVPDTRHVPLFVREFQAIAGASFRVPGVRATELLIAGVDPGGNSVIVLPRQRRAS
jgi:transcriptional regulator with XRE-family HTH domain